jgi:hypothetical protein
MPNANLVAGWMEEFRKFFQVSSKLFPHSNPNEAHSFADMFWPNSRTQNEVHAPSEAELKDPFLRIFCTTYSRFTTWTQDWHHTYTWLKYGSLFYPRRQDDDSDDDEPTKESVSHWNRSMLKEAKHPHKCYSSLVKERPELNQNMEDSFKSKHEFSFSEFWKGKRLNALEKHQQAVVKAMLKNLVASYQAARFMQMLWSGDLVFDDVIFDEVHVIRNGLSTPLWYYLLTNFVSAADLRSPLQQAMFDKGDAPTKPKKRKNKGSGRRTKAKPKRTKVVPFLDDFQYEIPQAFTEILLLMLSATLFNNSNFDYVVPALLSGQSPFNRRETWTKTKENEAKITNAFRKRFYQNLVENKKTEKQCFLAFVASQFWKTPVNLVPLDNAVQRRIFSHYMDRIKTTNKYLETDFLHIWDVSGEAGKDRSMKLKNPTPTAGDCYKIELIHQFQIFRRIVSALCPEPSEKTTKDDEEAEEEGEAEPIDASEDNPIENENPGSSKDMFRLQMGGLADKLQSDPSLIFLDPKASIAHLEAKTKQFNAKSVKTPKISTDEEKQAIRVFNDPIYPDHGFLWFASLLCGPFDHLGNPNNDFMPPSLQIKYQMEKRYNLMNLPLQQAIKGRWSECRKQYEQHPILIIDSDIQIMKLYWESEKKKREWRQDRTFEAITHNAQVVLDTQDELLNIINAHLEGGAFSCKSIFKIFLLFSIVTLLDVTYYQGKSSEVTFEPMSGSLRTCYMDGTKRVFTQTLLRSAIDPLERLEGSKLDLNWLLNRDFVKTVTILQGEKKKPAYSFSFKQTPFYLTKHLKVQNFLFDQVGMVEYSYHFIKNLHFVT